MSDDGATDRVQFWPRTSPRGPAMSDVKFIRVVATLGSADWRVIEHPDGTATVEVPPELVERAREVFPAALVETVPT